MKAGHVNFAEVVGGQAPAVRACAFDAGGRNQCRSKLPTSKNHRRALGVACGAHVMHDGYSDLLYVLLPVWQAEFGLGYAEVGLLRGAYMATMSAFQIPAAQLAERTHGSGQMWVALGKELSEVVWLASVIFTLSVLGVVLGVALALT
jgi:hypothetical protein